MTLRNYSPAEIADIHQLVNVPETQRVKAIMQVAKKISKPFECVKKRLEWEVKTGNVKAPIVSMSNTNKPGYHRFSDDERVKVEELMDIPEGPKRVKGIEKVAKELGRDYMSVYNKLYALTHKKSVDKNAHSTVVHPMMSTFRPVTKGNEMRISYTDLVIDTKNKQIIITL